MMPSADLTTFLTGLDGLALIVLVVVPFVILGLLLPARRR